MEWIKLLPLPLRLPLLLLLLLLLRCCLRRAAIGDQLVKPMFW